MVSVHHRSKMTLAATDEFWHSPLPTTTAADECTSSSSSSSSNDQSCSLPPAHHQLLSHERTCVTSLNGHDHTTAVGYNNLDGYTTDDSSFFGRQKLSAVKQQGGGSWLLGFARLAEKAVEPQDEDDGEREDMEDTAPPGLVRVPSGASLDDDSSTSSSDDDSVASSVSKPQRRRRSGVSFSENVTVQPIPHSSVLSPVQRRKMFSTCWEVRQNKIRNKKEYRYDGYDWRNITEEWEMGVDMVTGELVHPVHEQARA
eukprot:968658_1